MWSVKWRSGCSKGRRVIIMSYENFIRWISCNSCFNISILSRSKSSRWCQNSILPVTLYYCFEYGLHGGAYSQPPQPRPLRWARRAGASAAGSCSPAAQSAAAWRSSPSPGWSAECRSPPRCSGGRAHRRRMSWWIQAGNGKTIPNARERRHKGWREWGKKELMGVKGFITGFVTRDRHELCKTENKVIQNFSNNGR